MPPAHSRFKPGVSGNPGGRPKTKPSFQSELNAELGEVIRVNANGKDIEITKGRAIAKELVRLAIGGNLRAAAAVASLSARSTIEADQAELSPEEIADLRDFVAREFRRRRAINKSSENIINSKESNND